MMHEAALEGHHRAKGAFSQKVSRSTDIRDRWLSSEHVQNAGVLS